ncbi:hypothetical protein TSUD_40870 [Trifolium subterraneum]|nr:hypothetical protein TSUD_40870 [Trifolium subterraneum]
MLVDRGGLWYRVLSARYGEEAGRLAVGGRRVSSWWRGISRIRDGESTSGSWFAESIARRAGDGRDTFFWTDPWLEGVPLSVRFRRLYDLSLHRTSTVDAICELGWEEGGAAWQWRRQLWAWEEELLAECRNLLLNVVLQPNFSDKWIWRHDIDNGYSVRDAYALLTSTGYQGADATSNLIWHKQVPVKVSLLAWRLFRNRLPTKDNLATRNVIPHDSQLCVNGCGGLETAHHLFLSCLVFAPLWGEVTSWIDISPAAQISLQDHFIQFIHSSGGQRARRSFLQLIWLCCIWVIWHERNNRIFKAKETTIYQMLDKVKAFSLWWLKASNTYVGVNSHMWWSNPFVCMGIN